jgi:hypothetical protein
MIRIMEHKMKTWAAPDLSIRFLAVFATRPGGQLTFSYSSSMVKRRRAGWNTGRETCNCFLAAGTFRI